MTAAFSSDTNRPVRLTLIGLLAFSVLQVCWWLVDQSNFARTTTDQVEALYAADMNAGRRMVALGVPASEITGIFPHLAQTPDGQLIISPVATSQIEADRRSHVRRYSWETGFFLLVLAACIGVLWRGLREEREVRRQQDNFLALVSHQFKTPLAGLRLSAETFLKRAPSPEYAGELARRMIDDVARLETMVTKILDSARLERGRVGFQKRPVDLHSAVAQIVSRLEDQARAQRVTIESTIPAATIIAADPMAVDTVLRNLLENAIAATATDGGRVNISSQTTDEGVEVIVADTGVGFAPGEAHRLFEKFHRIDTGDRQSNGGTGLGLFIVDRIMRFEKGTASASSGGPGKGATFSVVWPRIEDLT